MRDSKNKNKNPDHIEKKEKEELTFISAEKCIWSREAEADLPPKHQELIYKSKYT